MRDSRDTSSQSSSPQALVAKVLAELTQCPLSAAKRLHELSVVAESESRLEDALTFATTQLQVAKEANAIPAVVLALLTRGNILFKMNQFTDAIPELRDALRYSATDPSLPAIHRAHILYTASNLIAASLWKVGDRVAAATALKETTHLARTRFGEESVEVVKALFDQAHLAIEMRKPESEILVFIDQCVNEPRIDRCRASQLCELGQALYMNCRWDAATYTLQVAIQLSDQHVEKTQALLTLATIACNTSDLKSLHRYVDEAESCWMDIAPLPRVERSIAHLRAMAALQEGCEDTYREQMFKAQQRSEFEEPTIEDRIQIQFVRAQVLRRSGLHDEARREIEDAQRIVQRAIVSPLTRCCILLQQAFCEQIEGNYHESNTLIEEALTITHKDLDRNILLEARGRSLKAHNFYSLFIYSETPARTTNGPLVAAKTNAETALRLLTEENLYSHNRKVLLRLLSGITNHMGLDAEQASYDRQLAMLEARYPEMGT
jgi:tetratricopeptide (TPR) repeat protein